MLHSMQDKQQASKASSKIDLVWAVQGGEVYKSPGRILQAAAVEVVLHEMQGKEPAKKARS